MKINMKLVLGVIVAITIAGVALWYSDQSQKMQDEKKTIRVAYLPVVQALPFYIALEEGYFEDAGISVEPIKLDSPNLIIDALLQEEVDFAAAAASGITAISDFKNPGELKIFYVAGGDMSTTNDLLIVREDSDMQTIADLKDKKLGILPGIQFRTIAQHILAENGLKADEDVIIVDLAPSLQVQALAQGQVDALLTIEPSGTVARVKGIGRELIHAPMVQHISEPWYGGVAVVRSEYAENNPEVTEEMLEVFDRAMRDIQKDSEETKVYLSKYTALDEELSQEVPLPIFKMYTNFTEVDIQSLQDFFDIFTQYDVIDGKVSAKDIVYEK